MFIRHINGEWVTNMHENMNLHWVDGAKNVFKYFTDRTPRSFFEARETSLVGNYEYADAEFRKAQARDMLQYLWAGPISNASVDVVRGNHSVEVHETNETKPLEKTAQTRYVIDSSQDVVDLLYKLAVADTTTTMTDSFSRLRIVSDLQCKRKFETLDMREDQRE